MPHELLFKELTLGHISKILNSDPDFILSIFKMIILLPFNEKRKLLYNLIWILCKYLDFFIYEYNGIIEINNVEPNSFIIKEHANFLKNFDLNNIKGIHLYNNIIKYDNSIVKVFIRAG